MEFGFTSHDEQAMPDEEDDEQDRVSKIPLFS